MDDCIIEMFKGSYWFVGKDGRKGEVYYGVGSTPPASPYLAIHWDTDTPENRSRTFHGTRDQAARAIIEGATGKGKEGEENE